jgi:LPS-assembly protein
VNEPSDDLFFRRYQITNADVLTNRIDVSRYYGADYLNINARQFRNTLSNETTDTVDFILPDVTYIKQFDDAPLDGQMQLVNRVSYSARDLGVDVTKASTRLDWSYRHISDAGFVWNLENKAQLDAYMFDEHGPETGLPDSETETLAADSFGVTLSYPLVRRVPTSRQTLKPMAQLVLASDNDRFDRVPHRTGAIYELNANNLFSLAAPEDETSRVNYGVDHALETAGGLRTRFFVGQSYNLSNDSFSMASGFSDEASSVVTEAEIGYRGLSLSQNLRIDREDGKILRHRTRAGFQGKRFSAGADYTFLDTGQAGNASPREELTSQFDVRLSDQWRFGARFQQDLELSDRIRDEVHLTYQDDCTYIQLLFDRDHRQVGTIEPETQVRLVFALRTLGGIAPGSGW